MSRIRPFQLSFANSFWFQEGIALDETYQSTLETNYGITINKVDFFNDSEEARNQINTWTYNETDGHIEEMLTKDAVNANSKIVLVNAMYLKALWSKSFFKNDTTMSPFYLEDGTTVSVPLMHQVDKFRHIKKDGIDMLCMRYKDSDFGLVSLLPEEGRFDGLESALSNEVLDHFASELTLKNIDLYYPKFEIESEVGNLKEMLIEQGMQSAFSDQADFSGIDASMHLKLSNIVQKIYFKIDEEGTEAASSTAVSIGETDSDEALELRFDRPFMVMICHIPSRTVLFMGRVKNPLL